MSSEQTTAAKASTNQAIPETSMRAAELVEQATQELHDRPARAANDNIVAQNDNPVPSAEAQRQAHLQNASILYAKAGACFERAGLYQEQVMAQAQGQQR